MSMFTTPQLPGEVGGSSVRKAASLRMMMRRAVTELDIFLIMRALVERAKEGDLSCAREVFDRTVGKPEQSEIIERLEELEAAFEETGKVFDQHEVVAEVAGTIKAEEAA